MKKLFAFIVFIQFSLAYSYVLDFSHNHAVEDLKKSGLPIKILSGFKSEKYVFQNQEVKILLPGGRSINQIVQFGSIDTKDAKLEQLSIYGDVMPVEQAFKVAEIFHQSFNLPTENLLRWFNVSKNKTRDFRGYSISVNLNYYPRIGFGADPSINGLYPCVIGFQINWNWDKHRDWNEERAWKELPPPDPKYAAISLEPPSGLKYNRRDAYKEIIAENEKLQAKLREEQQQSAQGINPNFGGGISSSLSPAAQPQEPVIKSTSAKFPKELMVLVGVGLGIVVLVLGLIGWKWIKK